MTTNIPEPLRSILDLARWAPSGDNLQPWSFEILGEDRLRMHIRREGGVYDFGGAATYTTTGVMLETLRIAATRHGRGMQWSLEGQDTETLRYNIFFPTAPGEAEDPLADWIQKRSVDRRPYRLKRLTEEEKRGLESAVGTRFEIRWFENLSERWSMVRLSARATWLRLSLPETFAVHQRIIDWQNDLSPNLVPARAVGLDPMTRQLMRWALGDWRRASFLNRYLLGPLIPVLEMDILPGLASGAQFVIVSRSDAPREAALIEAGQAVQRLWLRAASLGLAMQPTFATLAFAYHGEQGIPYSTAPRALDAAKTLAERLHARLGVETSQLAFMGRIGHPKPFPPGARSTRKPLASLIR